MTERSFELQRFFFGKFKPDQAKPAILARTEGITSEQIAECLQIGRLDLPPASQIGEQMPSSVGVFRGTAAIHILTVAAINRVGLPQVLYLIIEPAAMSWLGGNLQPFKGIFFAEMPIFESMRNLAPLKLDDPKPLEEELESETLQNLLLYCQDNMKVVEGLLTALINGQDIDVLNAPPNLEQRLYFVEGLMAMLPLPARPTITFATSVNKPDNTTAQIRFLAPNVAASSPVTFDWQTNILTSPNFERHDYARFVTSQLRLDPSLVVQHTRNLSRTASWRAIRRDTLSNALLWISRRARVDSAVQAGQPADHSMVTRILREDPTLTDELRVVYSKHLLTMAFITKEWATTDVLPEIAHAHADVAKAVLTQLREKAQSSRAIDVYDLIEYWFNNVSAASALPWHTVAHLAAIQHLKNCIENRDLAELLKFIYRLTSANTFLKVSDIAEQVVDILRPGAHRGEAIAMALFTFGAEHLAGGPFQALLHDKEMVEKLPERLRKAIEHLQPEPSPIKPLPDLLAKAVHQVPSQHQVVALVRLIETAMFLQRFWLIGERELRILVTLSDQHLRERFAHVLRHVADEFSQPERLAALPPPAFEVLPRLYFMVGEVDAGMHILEYLQNDLLTVERLSLVSDLVGNIFLKMNLEPEHMLTVLAGFDGTQMRPEPRLRAYYATLVRLNWDKRLDILLIQIARALQGDPRLVRVLGTENTIRVLQTLAERENAIEALRLAEALVRYALSIGSAGAPLLAEAWKHLQWNPEVKLSSLELLRRYIRAIDPDRSQTLPAYFADNISADFGEPLKATRLMRIIMGDKNLFQFSEMLVVTQAFLFDLAVTYHEGKVYPPIFRLRHDLDSMPGTLTEEERQILIRNLSEIARLILEIGKYKIQGRASDRTSPSSFRSLLREARETPPITPNDFLTWFGLQFSDTMVTELGLERKEAAHIFGARSVVMLYQETLMIYQLLYRLSVAFPKEQPPIYELEHLKAEIDSLWKQIPFHEQQRIQSTLGITPQQIALLISYIADRCDAKALGERGVGKQLEQGKRQPQNEIEALRFINGYFARKHTHER
ncbi:MAG: hypothetical protein CUN55_10145 [Phototrophicales bacterium]|nr:MAG: hypothetical protein CUN55_10145 [Phototrophicales bacterium]